MHYWNRDNFEGLLTLAGKFDADERLGPLASYCRFREQGLRREAFGALEDFLAAATLFDTATARATAVRILELNARTAEAHQFLAQPLTARFLLPTLRAWAADDPNAAEPVRWLGMQLHDGELLERALRMRPDDLPVRLRLVDMRLSAVDYATHRIDEGFLIGKLADARADLQRVRELLSSATESARFAERDAERQSLETLLDDWESWSAASEGPFPAWCERHGRQHWFAKRFHYRP